MVKVNGELLPVDGKTLSEYLETTSFDIRRIVIERNEEIVSKSDYNDVILKDGDIVEVVSFVGGG